MLEGGKGGRGENWEDDACKSFNFNLNFNHNEDRDHVGVSEECRGHSAPGAPRRAVRPLAPWARCRPAGTNLEWPRRRPGQRSVPDYRPARHPESEGQDAAHGNRSHPLWRRMMFSWILRGSWPFGMPLTHTISGLFACRANWSETVADS